MKNLFLDLETYSEVPIKNGTYAYAENSEILLCAYALDDEPVRVWDATDGSPMPPELYAGLANWGTQIVIHNSMFDRNVIRHCWKRDLPPARIFDTMVCALSHGLVGSLGKLCEIYGLPIDQAKAKEGKKYVNLFCKPQPEGRKYRRATRVTHPAEWNGFMEYARLDVEAMRVLYKKLPRWNYQGFQKELWNLDQKINDRGFLVDVEFATKAVATVEAEQKKLAAQTVEITDGAVGSTTQRDELLKHLLEAYGVSLPDMQASTIERRMMDENLPEPVKELLAIRLQATTTSTSKYKALIRAVSRDNRLRGSLQYAGASRTLRWCIAEGSRVLVRNQNGDVLEKPIEEVLISDEVFDGDEWVTHEGVVFSGEKEVIEHDNVIATPEHNVYISTSEHITLGEAKQRGLNLWKGNI